MIRNFLRYLAWFGFTLIWALAVLYLLTAIVVGIVILTGGHS